MSKPSPELTREVYDELWEALNELDRAFGGKESKPTAESINARLWLEAYWRWQQPQTQGSQAEVCHQ